MNKKLNLLLSVMVMAITCAAQNTCSGKIIDSLSGEPIEFANIGIVGKGLGTVTDDKGAFSFRIPDSLKSEPVKISMIGYRSRAVSCGNSQTIRLAPEARQLAEVTVKPRKIKVKMLGNDTKNKSISAGFKNNTLGSELAVRLNIKHADTHLRKFLVNINYNKIEKPIFRFNLYTVGSDKKPFENILKQNIIIEPKEKEGLVEFDLRPYNLFVSDDVFIAIEWIKDLGNVSDLMFSSKLGGSDGYYRQASQDKWEKIPVVGIGLHAEVAY